MIARKILPGQPGTKKWIEKYGDKFVCLRYKYDDKSKRKIKTVELLVEEHAWQADKKRIPKNKIVNVKITYGEISYGKIVKAAGGRWNPTTKLWELPYKDVVELGLTDRIVQ